MRAILTVALLLSACRSGEVYTPDGTPAEARSPAPTPAPTPSPLPPFACGAEAPVARGERLVVDGRIVRFQMTECGALVFQDPAGDLFVMGPALDASARVAEAPRTWAASRRGDQLLVRGDDGWSWRGPDGASDEVDAQRVGFLRSGDEELAWACVDRELGTLDAEGFHPRVSQVRVCERAVAASDAPVIVFVDDGWALRAIDLASGDLMDLSEVPFVAASEDQLALSRDGRVLYHQPGWIRSARVGIFDLTRADGDRLVGAPRIAGGVGGVHHASEAGHVAAMPAVEIDDEGRVVESSVVALAEDGLLRVHRDVDLLSISPSGDRLLLQERRERGERSLYLADLGGLRDWAASAFAELNNRRDSAHRGAFVAFGRDTGDGIGGGEYWSFRWRDAELRALPRQSRMPMFVTEGGAALTRTDTGMILTDHLGVVRHTFDVRWANANFELETGELLLWVNPDPTTVESQLLSVSPSTGASRELFRGDGLERVVVDRDGARLAYVRTEPHPDDPTIPRSFIVAGGVD